MNRRQIFLTTAFSAALLVPVARAADPASQPAGAAAPAASAAPPAAATGAGKAVANIEAKSDSKVKGTGTFTKDAGKVALTIEIEGATPGTHAVHIHEKGDCSAADGASAGGHWNPTTEDHGKWGAKPFHKGDLGNVEVGADGKGKLTVSTDLWTIGDGAPTDVIGKAIIVHAGVDDFKTQPTGNAGGRVGCGVINAAK